MSYTPLLVSSLAFALYITCPRMTGMIASQAQLSGINPLLTISIGSILGIPMFMLLYYVLQHFGVGAAVLAAAALDVGAALLMGRLSFRSGVELAIITIFVYLGMRVAPLIATRVAPA